MEPVIVDEGGVTVVEGQPDQAFLTSARDVDRVIEACFGSSAGCVLLYASNLPAAFFDLSSRVAGDILQKLRNYRIRLAVVCPPGSVSHSSRFGEMVTEENRGEHFGMFETRAEAVEWIHAFA
ncbi:DUF4180 domain-containing protein [Polyangium fumosum]|uniref:DUF4180 domain-containing protein n=1 Tax=Polyangium fumosum TaxID=889272 RepID=A0A4U1JK75_9BACT|nr:DUF4180 domain-containing protein [Polyangium fumosum]TKD12399.1 DUF4180 domain-containing protein [Polyangium fumosum]